MAGSMMASEMAAGSLKTAEMAAGSVIASEMAAGSVMPSEVAAGFLKMAEMVARSVIAMASKIVNLSVTGLTKFPCSLLQQSRSTRTCARFQNWDTTETFLRNAGLIYSKLKKSTGFSNNKLDFLIRKWNYHFEIGIFGIFKSKLELGIAI